MPAKKTILIIEDEPHIVLGLKDALEFEGFRVASAGKGRDGVTLAKHEKPDAVLLDLMLPDVNGYKVCEDLRRWNPFVPIIMLTARSQEVDKIRGLDAGADDYVTKPFSIGELIARIRAIFRRTMRGSTRSSSYGSCTSGSGNPCRAKTSSRRFGASRRARRTAPSTTSSSSCAARSNRSPTSRSTFSPCTASATSSCRNSQDR